MANTFCSCGEEINGVGMTAREWYAGQALAGAIARNGDDSFEEIAQRCFRMADAMIEESRKQPTDQRNP